MARIVVKRSKGPSMRVRITTGKATMKSRICNVVQSIQNWKKWRMNCCFKIGDQKKSQKVREEEKREMEVGQEKFPVLTLTLRSLLSFLGVHRLLPTAIITRRSISPSQLRLV